ncbi:uncharacterized protein BKA78DRAFT_343335 [Phyllosticta capitalensis]|uniref:uncharacterized protein n=1 Tax=Phyllosticta capitalensis TaxID=121624 RepID=UPI003130B0C2
MVRLQGVSKIQVKLSTQDSAGSQKSLVSKVLTMNPLGASQSKRLCHPLASYSDFKTLDGDFSAELAIQIENLMPGKPPASIDCSTPNSTDSLRKKRILQMIWQLLEDSIHQTRRLADQAWAAISPSAPGPTPTGRSTLLAHPHPPIRREPKVQGAPADAVPFQPAGASTAWEKRVDATPLPPSPPSRRLTMIRKRPEPRARLLHLPTPVPAANGFVRFLAAVPSTSCLA